MLLLDTFDMLSVLREKETILSFQAFTFLLYLHTEQMSCTVIIPACHQQAVSDALKSY